MQMQPVILAITALLTEPSSISAQERTPRIVLPPAPAPVEAPDFPNEQPAIQLPVPPVPMLPGIPNAMQAQRVVGPLFRRLAPTVVEKPSQIFSEKEDCVLTPFPVMFLPSSESGLDNDRLSNLLYKSYDEWKKDRLATLLKSLEEDLILMDQDAYLEREKGSRESYMAICSLLKECNPLPPQVQEILSRHRRKETRESLSLEQCKRLEYVEDRAMSASMVRESRIPPISSNGAELCSILEEIFGATIEFADPILKKELAELPVFITGKENAFSDCFVKLCVAAKMVPEQEAPLHYKIRRVEQGETLISKGPFIAVVRSVLDTDTPTHDIHLLHDPSGAMIAMWKPKLRGSASSVKLSIPKRQISNWESECGEMDHLVHWDSSKSTFEPGEFPEVDVHIVRAHGVRTERLSLDAKYPIRFGVQEFQAGVLIGDEHPRIGLSINSYSYLSWPATSSQADAWTYRLADSVRYKVQQQDGSMRPYTPQSLKIRQREIEIFMDCQDSSVPKGLAITTFNSLDRETITLPLPEVVAEYTQKKTDQ